MAQPHHVKGGTPALVADPGSLQEIAAGISGHLHTVAELLEVSLKRIDTVEPAIEAWCALDRDGARTQAEALSEEARAGQAATTESRREPAVFLRSLFPSLFGEFLRY